MANDSRFQLLITPRSLAVASFVMVILGLVDGALPQAQMIATGGHVLVSPAVTKALLGVFLLLAVVWQPRSIRITGFALAWVACMVYLAIDAIYLMFHLQTSIVDLIYTYNGYYFYFVVCPLAMFVANEIGERRALKLLYAVFAVCFLLGTAQYVTQKPIVYTQSADNGFSIMSWQMGEELRVFSLFDAGFMYGLFCSLIGALSLASLLWSKSGRKLWPMIVFGAAAIGCFTTLTRNAYLLFLFSCVTVVLLAKRRLVGFVRYIPFLFLMGSLLVTWRGSLGGSTDADVTSNASLLMRLAQWIYYLTLYSNAPFTEKMLGLGLAQSDKASNDALFVIDNQFLAILIHIGLIGLVLICIMQWLMWTRLYKRAIDRPSSFTIATAAFTSTFLAIYFFNFAIFPYSLIFALAMLVRPAASGRLPKVEQPKQTLSAA